MQAGTNSRKSLPTLHKRSIREMTVCALIARAIANAAPAKKRRLFGPACGRCIIRAIAAQFKQHGDSTHMFGEWHPGTEPKFLPRTQSFDHYCGMPCNSSHSPKFIDGDREVFAKTPLDRLTQFDTARVTKIIRDQATSGEPFFLYYAHNDPHTPYQAGRGFKGSLKDGVPGDVLQETGRRTRNLAHSGPAPEPNS